MHLLEHLLAGGLLIDLVTWSILCCVCDCSCSRTCAHQKEAASVGWKCVQHAPFPGHIRALNLSQPRLSAGLVEEVLQEALPQKSFAPSRTNRQGTQESLGFLPSLVFPVLLSEYRLSWLRLRHTVLSLTRRSGLNSCPGACLCGRLGSRMRRSFGGPSASAFAKTPMPAAFRCVPSAWCLAPARILSQGTVPHAAARLNAWHPSGCLLPSPSGRSELIREARNPTPRKSRAPSPE